MQRSKIWTIPLDEFKNLICRNTSYRAILNAFGCVSGSALRVLKDRIKIENIDVSHVLGKSGNTGFAVSSDDLFTANSRYSRNSVRRRIIRDDLIPYECGECGISEWRGKPLSLSLDHINGVRNDHRLVNLRWICPNCDNQSPTFGGRNIEWDKQKWYCTKCTKQLNKRTRTMLCMQCSSAIRSKCKINPDELRDLVWKIPTTKIATEFGVSDKAIEKWCKKFNIEKPGPGYWTKQRN